MGGCRNRGILNDGILGTRIAGMLSFNCCGLPVDLYPAILPSATTGMRRRIFRTSFHSFTQADFDQKILCHSKRTVILANSLFV